MSVPSPRVVSPRLAIVQRPSVVSGKVRVPGDKSISHRALILAALGKAETLLRGLAPGLDVRHTSMCLQSLGTDIAWHGTDAVVFPAAWKTPSEPLDCGNSGTTLRLLAGLIAGLDVDAHLKGDKSLSSRPMSRIVKPLRAMGAQISAIDEEFAPLHCYARGQPLRGRHHELALSSAQVKSSLLLAGLFAEGITSVREPLDSRPHTEVMLSALGAPLVSSPDRVLSVRKLEEGLSFPSPFQVPADASSAAFLLVAALLHPLGKVVVEGVTTHPLRLGFVKVLSRMGAKIQVETLEQRLGEPLGNLSAQGGEPLRATDIGPSEVPSLIDEIPLLGLVMTQAHGKSVVRGALELRKKESDRISKWVQNFRAMGAVIEEFEDGFSIEGPQALSGANVEAFSDHRLAMTMTVAGLLAEGKTTVHGAQWADISFPEFYELLRRLTDGAVQTQEPSQRHV